MHLGAISSVECLLQFLRSRKSLSFSPFAKPPFYRCVYLKLLTYYPREEFLFIISLQLQISLAFWSHKSIKAYAIIEPGLPNQAFKTLHYPESAEDKVRNRQINRELDVALLLVLSFSHLFNGLDREKVGNTAGFKLHGGGDFRAPDIMRWEGILERSIVGTDLAKTKEARLVDPGVHPL